MKDLNNGVVVNGHHWNYPYVGATLPKAKQAKTWQGRRITVVRTPCVTAVYYHIGHTCSGCR